MSDNGGIGQKLLEVGVSAAKATAQEVKTTVSEASSQLTGNNIRSDSELKNIAASDEVYKTQRMGEIKKELASQKMRRFQEVSQWGSSPTLPSSRQEQKGPEGPNLRSTSLPSSQQNGLSTPKQQAEPLRQAMGKSEQGRNFKG